MQYSRSPLMSIVHMYCDSVPFTRFLSIASSTLLSSESIFGRLMLVFDTNCERFVPGPMLPLEPGDSKVSSTCVQGKMF